MPNILAYLRFLDLSEAGGIRHEYFMDSIDSFTIIATGDGGASLDYGVLSAIAGASTGGTVRATKRMEFAHFDFSWNKKRIFKTKTKITVPNVAGTYAVIYTGFEPGVGPAIGFKFTKDGIYGYVVQGTIPVEVLIKSFVAPPFEESFLLTVTLFPGLRAEFQVHDGTNLYTANLTTGLPSGIDEALAFFGVYIEAVDANYLMANFCTFYFFQDI